MHLDIEPLPGYHPEIGLLLASLEDSTREWRQYLGDVSDEAIVWQPAPGAYSIGAIILHIVDVEDFWFRNFVGGQERTDEVSRRFMSQETDQYGGNWPIPPAKPLGWYFDLHDEIRGPAFEALKGIEPNHTFRREARNRTYTLRWVVSHVLQHDSYTGGQAVAIHQLWRKMALGS